MTKGYWFATACTLALLAAGPGFAQSRPGDSGMMNQSANTGPMGTQSDNGSVNHPGSNGSMNSSDNNATMGHSADSGSMGMQSDNGMMDRSGRHAGRGAMHAARGGQTDTSQNADVERLNEQSYQAAQQGREFTPGNSGNSGMGSSGGRSSGMDSYRGSGGDTSGSPSGAQSGSSRM